MRKATLLTLVLATACDPSKLKTALGDLVLPPGMQVNVCDLYRQRGKELAESIWKHDWPVFAPIWETPVDARADENYCRQIITNRGARFVSKPPGAHSSSALFLVVALHPEFETWTDSRRASILCHEAAHIVWQKRRGALAAVDYLTVSGRLVTEGTAYALGDALLERYGVDPAQIARGQARRANRFPETYKVDRTVNTECVAGYFGDIRATLRERAGK